MELVQGRIAVAACVLALLLTACAAPGGTSVRSSSSPGPAGIARTCPDPDLSPNGPTASPRSSCAPALGTVIANVDCTASRVDGIYLDTFNVKTGTHNDGSVKRETADDGQCRFLVPQNYQATLSTKEGALSATAIIDFTPRLGTAFIGLDMRCKTPDGGPPCAGAAIATDQTYLCLDATDTKQVLARGSYATDHASGPRLLMGKPNRLVMSITGKHMTAYLNGRVVCETDVQAAATSHVLLTINGPPTAGAATVDVGHFYVFHAP